MVQAATSTSDGGKRSPSHNDGVTLMLDRMEEKSLTQDLRAGDSVNPSPKSGRLPPLHVTPGRENGSILDSPSVEIAPESMTQANQANGDSPKNNFIAVFESTKDSDDGSSEGDDDRQRNGDDAWRPNGESLDEVLQKLNVRDASDLENDVVAVENEAKMEIAKVEEKVDDITDKMGNSGDTVILDEMTTDKPRPESTGETKKKDENEKGEEKAEDGENLVPEMEIDLNENGEDNEDGENESEVVAEQKNDAEAPKDAKEITDKGRFESRMSRFLNTFRRKKLSEENVSLSLAWTTTGRRISSENTLVNKHSTDKPSVTNMKSGQPLRSKACVLL